MKVKIKTKSKHKNIQSHKANNIGKIRAKLQVENKSKNILQPKVQGASQEINHSIIEPFISFLLSVFSLKQLCSFLCFIHKIALIIK